MSEDWTEREVLKDGGIHGCLIRNKFVINKEEDSCAKVTELTHLGRIELNPICHQQQKSEKYRTARNQNLLWKSKNR